MFQHYNDSSIFNSKKGRKERIKEKNERKDRRKEGIPLMWLDEFTFTN